ncbi:MAG TPA: hypothetical protein ENN19_12135 [Chloroflexi bacterium]|nr:hypothetical protein [Chloroflexota bacterium]
MFSMSSYGQRPDGGPAIPVCLWSAQGPVCVERGRGTSAGDFDAERALSLLLGGPTGVEQTCGLWSAIPPGATLDGVTVGRDGTVIVRLDVPLGALAALDHERFEQIVRQIGATLEPLAWRDLRLETWDADLGAFVSLADFLPPIPDPRKETVLSGEEATGPTGIQHVGQPSAPGQGQPVGALSGKTVYVSAGHGWQWSSATGKWRTQRPPYPYPLYEGPIIEDHNNAEAVNQYLLHYLWNAGAQVWPVRERDMNGVEVVIDNDAPGPGAGYFETGDWETAPYTGTGYANTDYRWTETVTGNLTASAHWTATLPVDGRYAVYVWYRPGADRAPDAHHTIHHAGGATPVHVDQRHHGVTWHYVGTYGFRGGETVTVTLSNRSSQAGRLVVADAVRFGGGAFDDLSGIETVAPHPPGKPWWEVAAYYYTQRMGMPAAYGDVTARPIYARWEHAGTGDDAIYVSWHTNGVSGYQTHSHGTMSIIHNGEGLPITPGSEALRDLIHAELVHDIRAGWDADWPGYKRSMNLGELRLLWDDNLDYAMPGALIEIAYHDHPGDTDALKEPTFNMLAARAVYQGILKYFAQRDGLDLTELPEPPTHLLVQNVGQSPGGSPDMGRVEVSWRPSPTDSVGLVGDAAVGYRVYTSADGLGWSNGIPVAGTTAYLDDLRSGQLLFVRVTAVNAGGESFPTETLAVRVGRPAEILLVNGFDRLNRTMAVREVDPVEGENVRLWLDRMNSYNYVIQHAQVISTAFDSASNEAVIAGLVELGDYALLDWILGEESAPDETLDATERALLADFLAEGGALFLSGSEVGWHLDGLGADVDFYNRVLRAEYVADDAGTYTVEPVAGSIFEGLGPIHFDAPGMYDADYPDVIMPIGGAEMALVYSDGPYAAGAGGAVAAIQYADPGGGCERMLYFGFPFETIRAAQRPAVMARALDFLGLCLAPPVNTYIDSPLDGSAHRLPPAFIGMAETGGAAGLERVEVSLRGELDGLHWSGGDWSAGEIWLTATGTSEWSYELPGLVDGAYRLSARAWTADGFVDESPAEATFIYDTIPPTATTLLTPTGGVVIPAPVSVTLAWAPVEPDGGSALGYRVVLDGQWITTTQSLYTATHLTGGEHVWGVQVFDAAGNRSAWITDTFRYPSVETLILWPVDGSADNRSPSFAGTAWADLASELARVEVQVQRASDDRYWVTDTAEINGSAWITPSVWLTGTTWLSASGAVSWTYPLPWMVGWGDDDYLLRARAWTTADEVDLSPAEVRFTYDTIPPAPTTLITPTGGVTLPAVSATLVWEPVAPDGGSPLAYRAAWGKHIYTTSQTAYTVTGISAGEHVWGVQVFDAAGNHSAWVTDTVSIVQHHVWLPLILRAFSGGAGGCADRIVNGGFETDAGWVLNVLAVYDTEQTHTGARSARVGVPPGEPSDPVYSSVAQTVDLPAGGGTGKATLRLWVYPVLEGADADDRFYVSLTDEADARHLLKIWRSNERAWTPQEYDLSAYLGQRVTLYVGARNDGGEGSAMMYVDDVTLEVCQ